MGKLIYEGIWITAMGAWDFRHKRIPLWLLCAGLPGTVAVIARDWCGRVATGREIFFAMAPGILLLLAALTKRAGLGDGLVLLLMGVMERQTIGKIFLMSMLAMSLFAVVALAAKRVKRETRLPYLPFLAFAWGVGRFWG